ncbi:MAG: UDP-N-acetylglucosamine 2-epimerase (non-hydrolyzing) [Bdellovibrionaceae bacterium]|nr:UDP-N-acetylglucosamine 2-epimerase (non-hydrolyzing) [Bdellovibrio sp.]
MKVMTIVGTRPEIIKLSRVIAALDLHTEHILVHTGQNYDYELNELFFKDLEIRKPDHYLESAGDTTMETIANVLVKTDRLLEQVKPDAILLYGDTNSCMAVIPAKKKRIPIFHMEAGNRCFDQRVPEELNRKVVDHLSDINMPLTEHARRYLIAEGLPAEQVIKTGSCMQEVLEYYSAKIEKSKILDELKLKPNQYFVVSAHREENVDSEENFKDFLDTLNKLADKYKQRILVSTHPRTRKKLESLPKQEFNALIEFLKPFGFSDYVKLQKNSFCVISDSGTITEEASLLSIPAVMIRQAHERPEGMDQGILIMSGLKSKAVIHAVETATKMKKPSLVPDYNVSLVSEKVVKIILSYVDYINRTVWLKSK